MAKREMAKKKSGEQVEEPIQVNPINDVNQEQNIEVPIDPVNEVVIQNTESESKTEEKSVEAPVEKKSEEQKQETEDVIAPTDLILKVESRSTLGKVSPDDFTPSAEGWYTSFNDAKKRYNPGVFSNNQIGKFGTLRVFEDGSVEFVTHTDFEKRKKRFEESSEGFTVKLVSEDHGVLEYKRIEIQF